MFTKETWYNQRRLYHVFSFLKQKYMGTKEEIHETEIEIGYFVLYYHVRTDFSGVIVYSGIFPCAVADGDAEYGNYARCKRAGF